MESFVISTRYVLYSKDGIFRKRIRQPHRVRGLFVNGKAARFSLLKSMIFGVAPKEMIEAYREDEGREPEVNFEIDA